MQKNKKKKVSFYTFMYILFQHFINTPTSFCRSLVLLFNFEMFVFLGVVHWVEEAKWTDNIKI